MTRRRLGLWVLAVGVGLVALATLRPQYHWGPQGNPEALGGADRLANVILFLPVGVGLGLARVRWWKAALIGAALSGGVELAQLAIPGRFSNPWDVAMNGLGALLGVGLPVVAAWPARGRTALLGLAAVLACLAAEAWLAQPAAIDGPYAVRFRPATRHGRWPGALQLVRVGGTPLWAGPRADRLPARLAAGWPLRVDLIAPHPRYRPHLLLEIRGQTDRTLVQLASRGSRLRVRASDRGARLGLGQVGFWAPARIYRGRHRITLQAMRDGLCLTVDAHEVCGLGPSLARGWARVHQLSRPPRWFATTMDGLWMASLALLLAFWAPSQRWVVGALGVAVTAGVYLVANTALAAPPAWTLIVAVTAAFAVRHVRALLTWSASPAS